jgi:hypothetical protein
MQAQVLEMQDSMLDTIKPIMSRKEKQHAAFQILLEGEAKRDDEARGVVY